MFKIPKIEKSNFYIDNAMNSMQEYALLQKDKIHERFKKTVSTQRKSKEDVNLNKRKDLELEKIRFLNDRLNTQLKKIIKRFPDFRKVDDIYMKLINTSEVNVTEIKDHITRLNWIANAIDEFSKNHEYKIKKARSHETLGFIMKKYLGKVNSLFRKEKKSFEKLDEARRFLNKLPKFEEVYTVAIGGFPNVGKSTLMKKMTGSDVEIQNYPFTTKGLMFGYLYKNNKKIIQLIDTPGLLNREKNNSIEERANIVLRDFCEKMVFVLDFTESCGYSIEDQLKLFKNTTTGNKKEVLIYLSKTDIFDDLDDERYEEYESKIKKFKLYKDSDELKENLIESYLKSLDKFDPTKMKIIK